MPNPGSGSLDGGNALIAALAEYDALRIEIAWLIEHGGQLQNYAIGLSVGILPVVTVILQTGKAGLLVGVLLSLPIALSLLGLLYFRQHQEVYVVASYIKEEIRPLIRELCEREDLWTWEEFKKERLELLSARSPIHGASRPASVLLLRLAIFILPAAASLMLAISVSLAQGTRSLYSTYTVGGTFALLLLCSLDLVLMTVLIIRFAKESDLGRNVLESTKPI